MGRDCALEPVPIALAEGRPEDPRLRAPRSGQRLAENRPQRERLCHPTGKATKILLGRRVRPSAAA
jgi:hypothetical protein